MTAISAQALNVRLHLFFDEYRRNSAAGILVRMTPLQNIGPGLCGQSAEFVFSLDKDVS